MLVEPKKPRLMSQEIMKASHHNYDLESDQYVQLTNHPGKELMSDYWSNDAPQSILQQLLESNRATTEFCQIIFAKLQNIERQNQMLIDIFQCEVGCNEIPVSFADEGLTDEQVKERVLNYYQTKRESYPSDVAVALNFDLKRVINAVYQLEEEGILEG